MSKLVLDPSRAVLRVSPTINSTLRTQRQRVAVSSCYRTNVTDIHDKLGSDLGLKTVLALPESEYSVCIPAHTVYISILRKNMNVRLATRNLFDQNVIAAQFWFD